MQPIQDKETGRVEAFSDGVFAIAITLLVLNLKVPPGNPPEAASRLIDELLNQWPTYMAFFISFFTILIMWINHHHVFSHVKYIDGIFLFINGFLLMTVTVIPFPTALVAEHIRSDGAGIVSAIYSGTFFFNCLSFTVLWKYSSGKSGLLVAGVDPELVKSVHWNGMIGLVSYAIAMASAFFSAMISLLICFALALFYAVTGVQKHKSKGRQP